MIIRPLTIALGIALSQLQSVSAFKNTSPHFIVSSSGLPSDHGLQSHQSELSAKEFENAAASVIEKCSSAVYLLIHQPGIHASDLSHPNQAPVLRQQVQKNPHNSIVVEYGKGAVNLERLEKVAADKCGAHPMKANPGETILNIEEILKPKLVKISLTELPTDAHKRKNALNENDSFLSGILSMLNTRDYTIIYTSSPAKDLDQVDPHTPKDHEEEEDKFYPGNSAELRRRRVDEDDDDNRGNSTRGLGLFSKYQFMNYGVFYGLMALFVLFAILSFALNAISSIKVSYGAFEKNMAPAAQKKQ